MTVRERMFAGVYDRLLGAAEERWLGERRAALVGPADGVVLEIGGGTGANLPHYRHADRVVLAEPSPAMRDRLAPRISRTPVPVTVVAAGAEDVPYPDAYFDTVVSTLVLCTVGDLEGALAEIRRVLRPGGAFRFLEHVRGDPPLSIWQDRVTPVWRWCAVGCEPNRDILAAIEAAGFTLEEFERFESPEPLPIVKPHITGVARH